MSEPAEQAQAHLEEDSFTAEQLYAIEHRPGELLVDAGAGSGKTAVLVERFVRSVENDGVAVGQILAITFTEKAAGELRERIRARLRKAGDPTGARAIEGAWISTIHAFCARLLRTHALHAGIDPDFSVVDESAGAELRLAAFDAAISVAARSRDGAELIGAYGLQTLREATIGIHDELRARGMSQPALPQVQGVPSDAELEAAARQLLAQVKPLRKALGRGRAPGKQVQTALDLLARAPDVLADELLWPGDVYALRLKGNAAALRTDSCDEYNNALTTYAQALATVMGAELRDVFEALLSGYARAYRDLKRERSVLDFADLELMARDLLADHQLAGSYRDRFLRVMIDELQDTNRVQLELIDAIAGLDLFMVGDAQQSIYGFRHADVELFRQRGEHLARLGARASLTTNFRSQPAILAVVNAAFAGALGTSFMALRPGREAQSAAEPLVEMLIVDRGGPAGSAAQAGEGAKGELDGAAWRVAEARVLARRVRDLIGTGQAQAGDVVVLTRATTGMRVYEQALEQEGVPTYVIGGRGYWSNPQVLELIAYLRALANKLDTEAWYTVLASPLCGLSLDGLVLLAAGAAGELSGADAGLLARFEAWFDGERLAATWLGPEQLLERALTATGYELLLAAAVDGRRRLANVRKLLRIAREWQQIHGSDLRGFLDSLRRRATVGDGVRESEAPVQGESLDAVRLMTIHRAKGLEFPVVCVADLGRVNQPVVGPLIRVGRDGISLGLRLGRPGTSERVNALAHDELVAEQQRFQDAEERRLFYVAMTRARERLILSGAARFDQWENANRGSAISWLGPALVPDIASRSAEFRRGDVSNVGVGATGADPREVSFVTALGVRVSLLNGLPPRLASADQAPPDSAEPAGDATVLELGQRAGEDLADGAPQPSFKSFSYTALASYERCPYRFYVERVLGLPELPPLPAGPSPRGVLTRRVGTAAQRGLLVHELLARMNFQSPSLEGTMPAEVRAMTAALIGSSTFARLTALRDVRREQPFAFRTGPVLISGVFDLIGRELRDDHLLVVDYKSDALLGGDPEQLVGERYRAQRAIYALGALKLGAAAVEVCHLFLEAPDDPATAVYTAAETPALERDLAARVAGPLAGNFPVTGAPNRRVCDGCPAQDGLCSYPVQLTSAPSSVSSARLTGSPPV
ncbi:MAG: UvrD-helicase domain-containing protein [Solirubrobacteraceae bacterium]